MVCQIRLGSEAAAGQGRRKKDERRRVAGGWEILVFFLQMVEAVSYGIKIFFKAVSHECKVWIMWHTLVGEGHVLAEITNWNPATTWSGNQPGHMTRHVPGAIYKYSSRSYSAVWKGIRIKSSAAFVSLCANTYFFYICISLYFYNCNYSFLF